VRVEPLNAAKGFELTDRAFTPRRGGACEKANRIVEALSASDSKRCKRSADQQSKWKILSRGHSQQAASLFGIVGRLASDDMSTCKHSLRLRVSCRSVLAYRGDVHQGILILKVGRGPSPTSRITISRHAW